MTEVVYIMIVGMVAWLYKIVKIQQIEYLKLENLLYINYTSKNWLLEGGNEVGKEERKECRWTNHVEKQILQGLLM